MPANKNSKGDPAPVQGRLPLEIEGVGISTAFQQVEHNRLTRVLGCGGNSVAYKTSVNSSKKHQNERNSSNMTPSKGQVLSRRVTRQNMQKKPQNSLLLNSSSCHF